MRFYFINFQNISAQSNFLSKIPYQKDTLKNYRQIFYQMQLYMRKVTGF